MDSSSLSIGLAFLGGLVSFASPCVLPLVPSFLSFIAGKGSAEPRFGRTLFFILGFSLVFVAMGVIFSTSGLLFAGALPVIRTLSGLVVLALAVHMVFPFLPFLNYEKRAHVAARPTNGWEALVVGMAFGAGWTPCIGPLLASILFLAGADGTLLNGLLYLTTYALGLGTPFLAASLWMDHFKPILSWMRRHHKAISWTGAGLMFLMGVLILSGQFTILPRLLVQWGSQLQEWTSTTDGLRLGHSIATALYGGVFLAPASWNLISGSLKKRLSARILVLSGLSLSLGAVLIWAEWSGTYGLITSFATWLQFQGL